MHVIKRDGRAQAVHFDKITARIRKLSWGLDTTYVDPVKVAQTVILGLCDRMTTFELDELAAQTAESLKIIHPDYGTLAVRIAVSNLHKSTPKDFLEATRLLYEGKQITEKYYKYVESNWDAISAVIVSDFDFYYTDYFGFKTLTRTYLKRVNGQIIERPQYMLMRVACGIHINYPIVDALETYRLLHERWFIHATPTLFNAGSLRAQLSSCFLLTMQDDSVEGIFNTLKQCAQISKDAGGIGLSISNIRAEGSYIHGTAGHSNGIVPMLRVFNNAARYIDQGGGKRKGSFATYLEPWHADVFGWLDLKKNTGTEDLRARDLFAGLWIPDLYMERVENDETWTLFCPNEAKGLMDCHGKNFSALYEAYEQAYLQDNSAFPTAKRIPARKLWKAVLDAQIETGTPYMCYKDTCNALSNQQHLGTIRSSNLCSEIIEFSSASEIAVCNLASICLPLFVTKDSTFDFDKLSEITRVVTRNLNRVIDVNDLSLDLAKKSDGAHRAIGIGVQGLADCFIKMKYPFDSDEARQLNREIFECIYFSACSCSYELAQIHGMYSSFPGSPMSRGLFQFDLWEQVRGVKIPLCGRYDWNALRQKIMKDGMRNSLLIALMPTASTSQILGSNECIEPYTSNIYVRRTLAGEFTCVSKHLMSDLLSHNLWTREMQEKIISQDGSVQNIPEIPEHLKLLYKTAWEINPKVLIDLAADRQAFICQSQSLNLFVKEAPSVKKLTSMHFYAWKKGLKTGIYYLRTKPAANPIQFTLNKEEKKSNPEPVATKKRREEDTEPVTKKSKRYEEPSTEEPSTEEPVTKKSKEQPSDICTRDCLSCSS